ncbi:phage holin family protein [Nocardia noduli]|uniref:phage holin family protein n=1 Tax=Nocardia noduli TaxID=2815722 RepID=UPI001C24D497|nr:phage holin family protein [Nocardia noduli]
MAAQRAGFSAWPEQWRWDDDRVQSYRARGMSGVVVEEITVGGVRESGVLLPMRQPPKWQGVVFLLMGLVFLSVAVLLLIEAILIDEWLVLVGVPVFVAIAGVALFAAYRGLIVHRLVVPGLVITPTRVVRRGGSGDLMVVAWADIAGVRPYVRETGPAKWHNMFGVDVRDPDVFWQTAGRRRGGRVARALAGAEVVMVSDAVMLMNPLVAYHLIRHYLENPDLRPHVCRSVRRDPS